MKVALVGIGGMGKNHYNIYSKFEDIEFVAACDIREERRQFAKELNPNVKLYADYAEMLETEKSDVVDVCTPTFLHKEHAIAALRAGAHVICEKPMALNSEETKEIIDEAKKLGKFFMAAHVVRFMKPYAYLAEAIKSEKYGKLLKLNLRRISPTPTWSWENWFLNEERSGHTVLDLVIHDIDFMQSVLGEPNEVVGAHYSMKGNTNYASAIYLYDNCSVSIEGGWFNANPKFFTDYLAIFENGHIQLKDKVVTENGEVVDLGLNESLGASGININTTDGYTAECRYFLDCVKAGKQPDFVAPESSDYTVRLVEKTLEKLIKVNR